MMVNHLFDRVSKLSGFAIKEAKLGKLINLVSNDMNTAELKLFFLLITFFSPVVLIAGCVILYLRLGPWGLIGIGYLVA